MYMHCAIQSEYSILTLQVKSEKWRGMFVDLTPGDKLVSGSVIHCHVENVEARVSMHRICLCMCWDNGPLVFDTCTV